MKLLLFVIILVIGLACTAAPSQDPPMPTTTPVDQPTSTSEPPLVSTTGPARTPESTSMSTVVAEPSTAQPTATSAPTTGPAPTAPPIPTATPLPAATAVPTLTPVPSAMPTRIPTATAVPTATPTPTPAPTATAVPTATPVPPQAFGDGTWIVGSDIQPGTYAAGPGLDFCTWKRLSGFSGEFEDIIEFDVSARPIVTISATDTGFDSRGCNNWEPIAQAITTPTGDGTWLVGEEIAPGTYAAGPGLDFCTWKRLSGFSGEFEDIIEFDVSARPIVTISATDTGFDSRGCNNWEPIAQAITTPTGDGTWLVGEEIAPGTYAAGPGLDFCTWKRLSGFSGEFEDIIEFDVSARPIVTISATDTGFDSRGCNNWEPIAQAITTPTGDGTWLVGEEIAPGTYSTPGGDFCSWKRLRGFSGAFEDIIAFDFADARQIVTIQPKDVGFTSSGCGAWTEVGVDA